VSQNKPNDTAPSRSWKTSLTVIGALIVFLTYVVKEGLKDNAKESRDSLQTALKDLSTRDDFDRLYRELHPLYREFQNQKEKERVMSDFKDEIWWEAEDLERKAIVVGALAETLPKKDFEQRRRDLEDLAKEARLLAGEARPVLTKLISYYINPEKPWKEPPLPLLLLIKEYNDKIETWTRKLGTAKAQFESEATVVIDKATKQKQINESRLRFWTRASYALYTIGWALGLLGKFTGVRSTSEEE
jgi:hypothetical protein